MKSLIRPITQAFGVLFTLLGIAGFITNGFWVFGNSMMQNIFYIATGMVGLWAAMSSKERMYLLLVAVVYAAVSILGFMEGDIFGLFSVSVLETYVHTAIAVFALLLGTSKKK